MSNVFGDPDRKYGIPGIDDQTGAAQQAGVQAYQRDRDGGGDSASSNRAAIDAAARAGSSNPLTAWMAKQGVYEPGAAPYSARSYAWLSGGAQNPFGDADLSNWGGTDKQIIEAARSGGDWQSLYDQYGFGGGNNVAPGMGDVQKASAKYNTNPKETFEGKPTKATDYVRTQQLMYDPRAAINEAMAGMGMGTNNQGPLANYMRGLAGSLKPAYYLSAGQPGGQQISNPQDYLGFVRNFLGTMGGSVGNIKQMAMDALGANPGRQGEGWAEMFNGLNPDNNQPWLSDDEKANWVSALYNLGNMGNLNPFQRYMSGRVGRTSQDFTQEYGAGRLPDTAQYMDYVRGKAPELFGW